MESAPYLEGDNYYSTEDTRTKEIKEENTYTENQDDDLREQLFKTEEEIVTLRQVLNAKLLLAQDLKRQLGITAISEMRGDIIHSINTIKESNTFKATSIAMKNVKEKTSNTLHSASSNLSTKLGMLRNSNTFKSIEGKMGTAYSSVKNISTNLPIVSALPKPKHRLPKSIYDCIKGLALMQKERLIIFENQTLIPNKLKTSFLARKSIISYTPEDDFSCIHFQQIIWALPRNIMHLHVAEGKAELISRPEYPSSDQDIETVLLDWKTSWEFTGEQMLGRKYVIHPIRLPLVMMVEIIHSESCPYPKELERLWGPDLLLLKQGKSIIWDVSGETVILAVRYARVDKLEYPVQIVLLSDGGGTELDILVCPRAKILDYQTSMNGLCETDLLGETDEYAAYNMLISKLRGKIVVGYNVYKHLIKLKVDLSDLAGVREIKTNTCFGSNPEGVYQWHLRRLITAFLNIAVEWPIKDAHEEAEFVRRLYIMKESTWKDYRSNKEYSKIHAVWMAWLIQQTAERRKEFQQMNNQIIDLTSKNESIETGYEENTDMQPEKNISTGIDVLVEPLTPLHKDLDVYDRSPSPETGSETENEDNSRTSLEDYANPKRIKLEKQVQNI